MTGGASHFGPPHNIQAEQALLGAILLDNANYGAISGVVGPADFFEPLHQQIMFQAGELIGRGQSATPVTLKDAFPPTLELPHGVSIGEYLARLMREGAAPFEVETYVTRVRALAQNRAMLAITADLRDASNIGNSPETALAEAWDRLDAIRTEATADTGHRGSIAHFAPKLLETDTSYVVSTGLVDLDHAIAGGWRAGRLYVIAGRPAMGKTVFGTSSARKVVRKGEGGSIFSLEIDNREVNARIAADELHTSHFPIPYRDIVAGQLDERARESVRLAIDRMSQWPLRQDDSGGVTMPQIEARARVDRDRFAKEGKRLALVVIDYIGLVRATDRYRGNRVHELGEIAWAGKSMAKRLDCAVLMLSQLNRGVEQRDDKRPTMSDLRDSGNIEEHADFVGLLYRPHYYLSKSAKYLAGDAETMERAHQVANKLELIIGKNRLGATPIVDLWCDLSVSAIDNASRWGR